MKKRKKFDWGEFLIGFIYLLILLVCILLLIGYGTVFAMYYDKPVSEIPLWVALLLFKRK